MNDELISSEGQRQIQAKVVDEPNQEYRRYLDRFAAADTICYPAIPSAIDKAEAELKARRAIPRTVRAAWEKHLRWAEQKSTAWQQQLELIEVKGENNLLSALKIKVGGCKAWLEDHENAIGRLERWIQDVKNPILGPFTAQSVARADWGKLACLLSRPGALEAALPAEAQDKKEIERLEEIVRRRIENGEFGRRPRSSKAYKAPKPEIIQCDTTTTFDPRDGKGGQT